MVLGKKVTIFDWEWGRNLAPRDGQKRPCAGSIFLFIQEKMFVKHNKQSVSAHAVC